MTKFKFKMVDGRHFANVITRLPMDRFGRNLGGHIPSSPEHVRHGDAVATATAGA